MAIAQGFQPIGFIGDPATRNCLLEILAGEASGVGKPALLVTASHGLGLPDGDPGQRLQHGALVTQDWKRGPVGADAVLSGDDVADARVAGMMAFVFACYGAGTPAFDDFPRLMSKPPKQITPEPSVAHLPKALLSHPGALRSPSSATSREPGGTRSSAPPAASYAGSRTCWASCSPAAPSATR